MVVLRRHGWEHPLSFRSLGRPQRQLSKIQWTGPKEAVEIEWWYRLRKGKPRNRMSNWNVSIASVMDLNIRGWREPAASTGGNLRRRRRWRCGWGWQFDSDILVQDLWVQGYVLFQSLVSSSGDLDSC